MARRDKSKVSKQFYRTGNTNHRQQFLAMCQSDNSSLKSIIKSGEIQVPKKSETVGKIVRIIFLNSLFEFYVSFIPCGCISVGKNGW